MLTKNDSIVLKAFLTAFDRLEQTLDEATQKTLDQVIENLETLAKNSAPFKKEYDRARIELLGNYQSQSRNKFVPASEQPLTEQMIESTQPEQHKRIYRKQGVLVIDSGELSGFDINMFIDEMREERIQSQIKEIGL